MILRTEEFVPPPRPVRPGRRVTDAGGNTLLRVQFDGERYEGDGPLVQAVMGNDPFAAVSLGATTLDDAERETRLVVAAKLLSLAEALTKPRTVGDDESVAQARAWLTKAMAALTLVADDANGVSLDVTRAAFDLAQKVGLLLQVVGSEAGRSVAPQGVAA